MSERHAYTKTTLPVSKAVTGFGQKLNVELQIE
ncbi:MAG: hypothetical protein ACI8YI_000068 [Paracoccaceae bacterium]|jgi:hypothetical protein